MKLRSSLLILSLLPCVIFIASSCVSNKSFEKPFENEIQQGVEFKDKVFLIKKNGEKIEGQKLEFSKKRAENMFGKEVKENRWIAIDGQKTYTGDVNIIQYEEGYKAYFTGSVLSGFISRIRYGKLNLYYYTHPPLGDTKNPDVRGSFHAFVFQKGDEKLQELFFENLSATISDNSEALAKLKALYPKSKIPRFNDKENLRNLLEVVDIYNK